MYSLISYILVTVFSHVLWRFGVELPTLLPQTTGDMLEGASRLDGARCSAFRLQ